MNFLKYIPVHYQSRELRDPVTLGIVVGGTALLGGVAGAVKGAKGTPDQNSGGSSATNSTSTQTTSLGPVTGLEQNLQDQSLQQYLGSLGIAQQQEAGIGSAQGVQDQSRALLSQILSGQGMGPNAQETAQIQTIRDAMVNQGQTDVNRLLDDRFKQLGADAGRRGLRGQAYSELQGQAVNAGSQRLQDVINQANQQAAQLSVDLPYKRLGLQSQMMGQGLNLGDALRQQALQNRTTLQNPYMLGVLANDRRAQATTTSTNQQQGTHTGVVNGQDGSWMDGLTGFLGGAAGGAGTASNLAGVYNNMNAGAGGADLGGNQATYGNNAGTYPLAQGSAYGSSPYYSLDPNK